MILVQGTIALAIVTWAGAEYLKQRRPPDHEAAARTLWTAGALLLVAHTIAAFHFVYGWSHRAAAAETARQTAELTGLRWAGGLFVNYAFLVVWVADAAWWWAAPASYRNRPAAIRTAMLAFFVFMFVNGGILFADGAMRALCAAAVAAVLWRWYRAGRD
ncbi:MAG: hypothetical protein ACRD09_06370 [Vicinamibacterales bacterium]